MSGGPYKYYQALRWFRVTVLVGLVANLVFALPAVFAPRVLEGWLAFGTTNTVHWLQNVGLLLLIVTSMYIPVLRDPFRYLFITVLVVAGRFAAGLLFLIGVQGLDYPEGMQVLAWSDLGLSLVQALLLYRVLADGDPRVPNPGGSG